ncbi:hypothetical protein V8B97DRAFT_1921978 [Scleroderma yunnanense]
MDLPSKTIYFEDSERIVAESVPDNFVSYTLKHQEELPPITWDNWYKEIHWLHTSILLIPPVLLIIGLLRTPLQWNTAMWTVAYGYVPAFGVSAGYHRLWAHRTYKASKTLEYILAVCGAGAVEGSIAWWARGHRAHHRYTDTDLDPYNAHKGFFYSHIGWMLFKPRRRPGPADVSDLRNNPVVKWQHRYYIPLALTVAIVIPTAVAGYGWGDWQGGFVFASLLRMIFVHHSTFCINSVCHWLGDRPYDDKLTPRDSILGVIVTLGEGYHNFHHQFPMDYRNGHKWYHYDPAKWFIWTCEKVGLASNLKTFSDNEVQKAELTVQLKHLRQRQEVLAWPVEQHELPVITWEDYQTQAESRALVCIAGHIHDVSEFVNDHPGGPLLIRRNIGKDATAAFFGGVYDHSNAAHNLLSMKRVAILLGGVPRGVDEKVVPPGQHFKVVRYDELVANSEWSEMS